MYVFFIPIAFKVPYIRELSKYAIGRYSCRNLYTVKFQMYETEREREIS